MCLFNVTLRHQSGARRQTFSFNRAVLLPLHLEPLLSAAQFQGLFASTQPDWDRLSWLTAGEVTRILKPESQYKTPLICNGVISFNEAAYMSFSDIIAKRFYYLSQQQPFAVNGQTDSLAVLTAEIERSGTQEEQTNTRLEIITAVLRRIRADLFAKKNEVNSPRIYYILFSIIQNHINTYGRIRQPITCLNELEAQTDKTLQAINTPRHYLGQRLGSLSAPANDWLTTLKKCLIDLSTLTFGQPEAVAANAATTSTSATSTTTSVLTPRQAPATTLMPSRGERFSHS